MDVDYKSGSQVIIMDAILALQEGITAYNQKNYVMALERLKPLAELGNAKAQFFWD
jgi:hypothetical protein